MKRISLIFLFAVAVCNLQAQNITSNSSAEECIRFIETAARSGVGKQHVTKAEFTGGTFATTTDFSLTRYKDVYSNINWADFDKITGTVSDGVLGVVVAFNKKSISAVTIETDTQTGFSKNNKERSVDYIYIIMPAEENEKLNMLTITAKRLQQLVKEKGNIFQSQLTIGPKIRNIEGKPSYEETIKFINDFIENTNSEDLFCNTAKFTDRKAAVGADENGNVILTSKYLFTGPYSQGSPQRNESFKINISNVEEIKVVTGVGFQGGCLQVGLYFIEKGKRTTAVMHLPLWKASFDSFNQQEFKDSKIYKAFNHLRKLAGAPDPIDF